jgi:hypothetical protein
MLQRFGQRLARALRRPAPLQAVQLAEVGDVLARGQALVHAARVGQHAQAAAHGFGVLAHIDAIDQHAALVRLHQGVEHAHGGGLAGAVGAEQAGDLAVVGGEADVIHGDDGRGLLALAGEGLAQVFCDDHEWVLVGKRGRITAPSRCSR